MSGNYRQITKFETLIIIINLELRKLEKNSKKKKIKKFKMRDTRGMGVCVFECERKREQSGA